ncbi:MAG: type II secretion system F family protein [Dehalococcoidia bacterium]|nr:type II secretion system F family protein [Dehalococcoidia bacterium]
MKWGRPEIAYQYVAYNENSDVVKGKLDVTTEEQATELLEYAGYQVISLRQRVQSPLLDKLRSGLSQVKPSEMILFYHQMALLIETGMNIVTALEILQEQASNRTLKKVLSKVISDVRGGSQLSVALSKHPGVFSPIHCQSLKVGESTGSLETMLRQISEHLEREVEASKGVKNAMIYPVIAFVVTIVVVIIMVSFVLPAFSKLYASMGAKLPMLTEIVINAGAVLNSYGVYLLLIIVFAGILVWAYIKTPGGRYNWDRLSLTMPLVGKVNHLNQLAQLSRNVSLLFHAGLPLTEIMPLVTQSAGNTVMSEALNEVREEMIGGEGLSRPMSRNKLFLPMLVQMVKVGEETGNLDNTLLSVAKAYEVEAEDKLRTLIGLIQPAMILIIGAVVGLLALSLVSAMYSIYSQVL